MPVKPDVPTPHHPDFAANPPSGKIHRNSRISIGEPSHSSFARADS
jgi:hypothetical protein